MQTVGGTEEETYQNIFYVDLGSNSLVSTIVLLPCSDCTVWPATKVTVKITDIAPTSANYDLNAISYDCGDESSEPYVFLNAVLTCGSVASGRYIVIQKYEVTFDLIQLGEIAAWTHESLAHNVQTINRTKLTLETVGVPANAIFGTHSIEDGCYHYASSP